MNYYCIIEAQGFVLMNVEVETVETQALYSEDPFSILGAVAG
jgi:hypothetical protein